MIKKFFCVVIILSAVSLSAQEKMRIAIMDLKADGVPERNARAISNMLRTDLVNSGKFIVVERGQMDAILKEQGFQKTGCTDQECAVEIGKLISVRKMMIGEVTEAAGALYITVRIVDIEKSVIEFAEKEIVPEGGRLDLAVNGLSSKIMKRIGSSPGKGGEVPKGTEDAGPPLVIVKGTSPSGISLSYARFTPGNADISHYYEYLQGLSAGYAIGLGDYFALCFGVDYVTADDTTGETNTFHNAYSAGARLGLPLFGFLYPYVSAAVKGVWLHEKNDTGSVNFTGYGFRAGGGLAVTFFGTVSLFGEYGYSLAKVSDSSGTDISGPGFSAGVTVTF